MNLFDYKSFTPKSIALIGVMTVLCVLLMFFEFPLPLCPPFINFDFSDVIASLLTLTFGLFVGVWVEVMKNLVHLIIKGSTGGIGEFANLVVSAAYLIPLSIISGRVSGLKGIALGVAAAMVSMTAIAALMNYFLLIPFYIKLFFGGDSELIIKMVNAVNPAVNNMQTLVLLGVVPFNIAKALIVGVITAVLFKSGFIKKIIKVG
jgi:riboflavin transporter FmnP